MTTKLGGGGRGLVVGPQKKIFLWLPLAIDNSNITALYVLYVKPYHQKLSNMEIMYLMYIINLIYD